MMGTALKVLVLILFSFLSTNQTFASNNFDNIVNYDGNGVFKSDQTSIDGFIYVYTAEKEQSTKITLQFFNGYTLDSLSIDSKVLSDKIAEAKINEDQLLSVDLSDSISMDDQIFILYLNSQLEITGYFSGLTTDSSKNLSFYLKK